jgi:hypothetical protein
MGTDANRSVQFAKWFNGLKLFAGWQNLFVHCVLPINLTFIPATGGKLPSIMDFAKIRILPIKSCN